MRKNEPYFTLFVREDGAWEYLFGSFDKDAVKWECEEWLSGTGYRIGAKRRDTKLVTLFDGGINTIREKTAELNR